MKTVMHSDGLEGHRKRAIERARKMDRGEAVEGVAVLNFADPLDMLAVLTEKRVRLFNQVKKESLSVSGLALRLKRDAKSVRRDVTKLEEAGVVRTRLLKNPGHGRVRIVEPVAQTISLRASL
jgi:predicted transcriptional regulator